MNNRITPFVKRMRSNGGTIYTFSSAVEDIGLNINERNNAVKISHFALLNIPDIKSYPSSANYLNSFNIQNIVGDWEYARNNTSTKDGRILIGESFQNYALNLEANLLNQSSYNPELIATVSERVFWKWLKETGAIQWQSDVSLNNVNYFTEDGSAVIKYVGQVSAGNVRVDTFGTYNETYVLLPTSHGQTRSYFKQLHDDNYYGGMEIGDLGENILGREGYTKPHPDGLSMKAYYDFVDSEIELTSGTEYDLEYQASSSGAWDFGWWYTDQGVTPSSTDNAYLIDTSNAYIDASLSTNLRMTPKLAGPDDIYFRRSNLDCVVLEKDLQTIKDLPVWGIGSDEADPTLTWEKMAIDYSVDDAFDFNAVLIYYTIYNATRNEVLGINLLGVMFLDAPSGNSSSISGAGILLPSLEKIMSGPTGFGTSYSLRLNIKTDNMLDDTAAVIVDESTSTQLWAEDWDKVFQNLNTTVNILTQQNSTLSYISGQYISVQDNQNQLTNQINYLQNQVNDIDRDIAGTANTVAMFADGDDPIVDSSIYMRFGNIGIKKTKPLYPLDVSGTTRTDILRMGDWAFEPSGNMLILKYDDVSTFTFASDGSIFI